MDKLIVLCFFVILIVAVYLSVSHKKSHSHAEPPRSERSVVRVVNGESIHQKIYEANERAHRKNHADNCRIVGELTHLRRSPINYGPPLPELIDGETVEGEVVEVAGLLK